METVLSQAYPSATIKQNPTGKPRKGSFEVQLINKTKKKLLYSKLDSYGPAKDRAALPDPVTFIISTVSKEFKDTSDESTPDSSENERIEQNEKDADTSIDEETEHSTGDEDYKKKLEKETVVSLKKMLTKKKLSTVGRKADLIERLCSHKEE